MILPEPEEQGSTLFTQVTNMYITDTEVTFTFDDALKHFQPNYKQKPPIYI